MVERTGWLAGDTLLCLAHRVTGLHWGVGRAGGREEPTPQTQPGLLQGTCPMCPHPLVWAASPATWGTFGVPAIRSTTPALYWQGQAGLTPATCAQPALSRQGAAGPDEARLVLASVAPPCLLSVLQQQVTHLTTGSRAPGMRPRDLYVPWTLGGGGRGISGVPMSVVGPISEAPACTALRLSSSEGSVPRGRGGGGASVTRLGISPAGRAILQPFAGGGGWAAGNAWGSQEA